MRLIDKSKVKRSIKIGEWLLLHGKSMLLPIIGLSIMGALVSLNGVFMAILSKIMIDSAIAKNLDKVLQTAALFGGLILFELGLDAISSVVSVRTGETLSNNIRIRVFKFWTSANWRKTSQYHSGDILTRMTSDVGTVTGGIVGLVPEMFALLIQLIAAFVTLMVFQPELAILAFCLTPLTILFSRIFAGKLGRMHKNIQEAESNYRSYMHESVQNIMIIKAFGLSGYSVDRINLLQNKRLDLILKRNWLGLIASSILSVGYWLGYFAAFIWGVLGIIKGTLTFGTMTAFLQLVGQIQSPFMGLAKALPRMIAVAASTERLMELENLGEEAGSTGNTEVVDTGIVFDTVSFGYEEESSVLSEVSFKIEKGETVGLIGPSGEGKTTIIRMLMGLIYPNSGKVYFVQNKDTILEACSATRKLIAYVPQGNTLFSGTILENIRVGNLNASEEEVMEAAERSCSMDFINEFPDGIHTRIGERGYGLSEGQAQRIAIARAIIRNAPVLVLDEATAALDSETEVKVLQSVKSLQPARTCIIVTHRKSALSICNRVLRLEDGRVDGSNEQIIDKIC